MKRIHTVILVILFLSQDYLIAQEPTEYKPAYIGISAFTSLLWFPTNLSLDFLKYKGKAYHGITLGYTKLLTGLGYGGGGAHLTYTRLAPKKRGFFETKLGIVVSNEFDVAWLETKILPLISVGFRHQRPAGKFFFRWALSTGFVGAGFGVNVN